VLHNAGYDVDAIMQVGSAFLASMVKQRTAVREDWESAVGQGHSWLANTSAGRSSGQTISIRTTAPRSRATWSFP
jgi:hypothetical protein